MSERVRRYDIGHFYMGGQSSPNPRADQARQDLLSPAQRAEVEALAKAHGIDGPVHLDSAERLSAAMLGLLRKFGTVDSVRRCEAKQDNLYTFFTVELYRDQASAAARADEERDDEDGHPDLSDEKAAAKRRIDDLDATYSAFKTIDQRRGRSATSSHADAPTLDAAPLDEEEAKAKRIRDLDAGYVAAKGGRR